MPARRSQPSRPLRVLVTAGPTREYLDSVRYFSNDSSGRMGFAIAIAAQQRGHAVALVHGPVDLPEPPGLADIAITSADQMFRACTTLWREMDVLIMAAAVADYTPAQPLKTKRKKSDEPWMVELQPTRDILARLAAHRRPDQVVIGFALEDRAAKKNAEGKLGRKGLDAIVLNRPAAIGTDESEVEILVAGEGWQPPVAATKTAHAQRIVELAEKLVHRAQDVE